MYHEKVHITEEMYPFYEQESINLGSGKVKLGQTSCTVSAKQKKSSVNS